MNLEDSYEYARFMHALLQHLNPKKGLEIGLGPGISAYLFLNTLPKSHLVSIDLHERKEAMEKVGKERITYHVFDSKHLLERIHEKFDYIYIDGSHMFWDVLGDARNAHELLIPGGHLVFDDGHMDDVNNAVDEFLRLYRSFYEEVFLPELGITNDHRARILRRLK